VTMNNNEIQEKIDEGKIVIDPFNDAQMKSNSYDVRLAKTLAFYTAVVTDRTEYGPDVLHGHLLNELDSAHPNEVKYIDIPCHCGQVPCSGDRSKDCGFVLKPGILYLGVTEEYTETFDCVPYLDGKSSIGRLGIFIHTTAGRGDNGFCGHWTMEISVVHPVRIYAGMLIGQVTYHHTREGGQKYGEKTDGKYNNSRNSRQANPQPVPSAMWKNFRKEG
jgi:dCTP deaminase